MHEAVPAFTIQHHIADEYQLLISLENSRDQCFKTETETKTAVSWTTRLYLTGDEDGLVAESFVVVDDRPVGSDLDLVCLGRIGRSDLQRGRDDGFGRRRVGIHHVQIVRVPLLGQLGVVVVVETLDEVHRLRVGVGDDSRLCLRVSHHVPPADTTVVASTQIVKYQYQYKYASLKYQYKYQYLKTVL